MGTGQMVFVQVGVPADDDSVEVSNRFGLS